MKNVMAHISDKDLPVELIRFHNHEASVGLTELADYVQMLIARISNAKAVVLVNAEEVSVIEAKACSIRSHLVNADHFTQQLSSGKMQDIIQEAILDGQHGETH